MAISITVAAKVKLLCKRQVKSDRYAFTLNYLNMTFGYRQHGNTHLLICELNVFEPIPSYGITVD